MEIDKFLGCVLGVATGDALGMPFETLSAKDIRRKVGRVDRYYSPNINSRLWASTRRLHEGCWTDDTQLTLATMEALIENGGEFDMDAVAKNHIDAYVSKNRRGWGRSTRNACKRLSVGISWRESGEPNGAGNGIVMKIAPLGLWHNAVGSVDDFTGLCIDFGRMTHLDPAAVTAGVVHAHAVSILAGESFDAWSFLSWISTLQEIASLSESKLLQSEGPRISEKLSLVRALYVGGDLIHETPESLAAYFDGGTKAAFSAYNSLGLSYVIFARSHSSFDAVFDAIAAGGDTDSNASIVGSLVGTLHGVSVIPQEFIAGLERSEWIKERIEEFFNSVNKGGVL